MGGMLYPGRMAVATQRILIGCALVVLLAAACRPAASVYEVRGVVRDVQREYGQLVVEHEDVPGLMPAMTMNFDVADATLLESLEPGDVIRFRLEVTRRSYRILDARVEGRDQGPGAAAPLRNAPGENVSAPSFRLTDQEGRPVSLADLAGRVVVLDFVYTRCPGPCPIQTGRQTDVQRSLPEAVRAATWFVSISLDPVHDTPERLREYARVRGADLADWSFLTGSPEEVDRVLEAYGVGRVRGSDGQVDHLVATFLIDREGRVARRFVGLDHSAETLRRAIERLHG
jgi:protein SCO1/2